MKVVCRGGVTLCARCARAHPVFGPDKGKDLCGHTQFFTWAHPVFIIKYTRERWGTPTFKNVTHPLIGNTGKFTSDHVIFNSCF